MMKYQQILFLSLFLFLQISSVLAQQYAEKTSNVKADQQSEWVKFSGTKINKGSSVILTAPSGESFSIKKKAIKLVGDSIFVRNNTLIQIFETPSQKFNTLAPCGCAVKILATNKEEHIPKHGCDTDCYGVILVCTNCVYNPAGVFIKEEKKICGGCIGLSF